MGLGALILATVLATSGCASREYNPNPKTYTPGTEGKMGEYPHEFDPFRGIREYIRDHVPDGNGPGFGY